MEKDKAKSILAFFEAASRDDIEIILLRNINDEIPFNLGKNKDIDLLARKEDEGRLYDFLQRSGFRRVKHPHRFDPRLYKLPKFQFYRNPQGVYLDITYKLACRSLDAGQWLPLDDEIQKKAWEQKRLVPLDAVFCQMLSIEVELVSLLSRCIFDKREFPIPYRSRIGWLIGRANREELMRLLLLVFFKFSNDLVNLVESCNYEDIITAYIEFRGY